MDEPIFVGHDTGRGPLNAYVRRQGTGAWRDSDNTFKTSGWTDASFNVTELSGAGVPAGVVGAYVGVVDPATWADDDYEFPIYDPAIATKPIAILVLSVKNGTFTNAPAIKAKTDQLTFTLAGKVDASIQAAGDFAQAAADKVWASAARTLTSFGTLAADVWASAARTLTAFAFSVTVGTNNDKTGYKLASDGLDTVAAPTDVTSDANMRSSFVKMFRGLFNRFYDQVDQTATQQKVRNDAGDVISTMAVSDDGTTQIKGESA